MKKSGMKSKKNKSKSKGLHGLDSIRQLPEKIPGHIGHMKTGIAIATAAGGVAFGTLILGKYHGWVGGAVALIGAGLGNAYITNLGVGCVLSPSAGFGGTSGFDNTDLEGLNMEVIKSRAKMLADTFRNKFKFPKKEETTSGLNGEQVSYFVNPYNRVSQGNQNLDLSQLDNIQSQIAQMNGLHDIDVADRNF